MQDFEGVLTRLLDVHYDLQCGKVFKQRSVPRRRSSAEAVIAEIAKRRGLFFRDDPDLADKPLIIRNGTADSLNATTDVATHRLSGERV